MKTLDRTVGVNVHHVTRVEGHGNIVLDVKNGEIQELRFEVPESPRFFEAMLVGRPIEEAPHITCRICGICSVGHTTASLNAVEATLGITPSEQTLLLRKLLFNGEVMQSHVLHDYFLVAPDFLGVGSVIPLAETHPDVVLRALRLKKLSNDICAVVAGRHVHPVSAVVKGFTRLPSVAELKGIRQRLVDAIPDLNATVDLFASLEMPAFERETEYLALHNDKEYAFIAGDIASTDGGTTKVSNYLDKVKEFVVPYSYAKFAKANRDSYMVGALARVNNNYNQLRPEAKAVADKLGFRPISYNPFMNNVAQLIETVHCAYDSVDLIDTILSRGLQAEDLSFERKAGHGVGAAEVPRGSLYHDYTTDEKGIITKANCIIPTAQNYANIEKDMEALVPQILDQPEDKIRFTLEMLVRAYDPCISCSVHLVGLKR